MRVGLIILVNLVFLVACSGGGSSRSSSPNEQANSTASTDSYLLGGVVVGIEGGLVISDGVSEPFLVNGNGRFLFPQRLSQGQYNIQILSRPKGQLCELNNARGVILQDEETLLEIRCANLVERTVAFEQPQDFDLDELELTSNFQKEEGLVSPSAVLRTFDNTFATLKEKESGEVIYLSHVSDTQSYLATPEAERSPLLLDADSTALGLLLLEPSIATAVLERAFLLPANVESVTQSLRNGLSDTEAFLAVVNLIAENADSGLTLIDMQGDLQAPLQSLIATAADVLIDTQGLSLVGFSENLFESGLVIAASQEGANAPTELSMQNRTTRTVLVEDGRASSSQQAFWLAGFDSGELIFEERNTLQSGLTFVGPGRRSLVSDTGREAFLTATVTSGLEQHFYSSVNLMTALSSPELFDLSACLTDEQNREVVGEISAAIPAGSQLYKGNYFYGFIEVFEYARKAFTGSESEISLDALLGCDKFGNAGIFIGEGRARSLENIASVMDIADTLFRVDQPSIDLFERAELTLLTASLNRARPETIWNDSNGFGASLNADKLEVGLGDAVVFDIACGQGRAAVSCELIIDYGDGADVVQIESSTGGETLEYTYQALGVYTIRVEALNEAGQRIFASPVTLAVVPSAPAIEVLTAEGLPLEQGQIAHNFGEVVVGSSAVTELQIKNSGTASLTIESISFDSSAYFAVVNAPFVIAPGAVHRFEIEFKPTSDIDYNTTMVIMNDDGIETERRSFSVRILSSGVAANSGKPAVGGWTIVDGDDESTSTAVRASVTVIERNGALPARLVLRFLGSQTGDFPQLTLSLQSFADSDELTRAASYSLFGRCDGFVARTGPEDSYCTSANDSGNPVGEVIISDVENQANLKNIQFQFSTKSNPLQCLGSIQYCESLQIEGLIQAEFP